MSIYNPDAKNAMLNKTTTHDMDFEAGKRDRLVGYYDKWYRYNHSDSGMAYDDGCKAAVASGKATDNCTIIECNQ